MDREDKFMAFICLIAAGALLCDCDGTWQGAALYVLMGAIGLMWLAAGE